MQKLNMDHVTRKKKTEANLKKALIKLLEICKTRPKKSILDMLNFYLLSAARDMVTESDSSTTCQIKAKAPSLKTNTKKERPSENMGFI